MATTFTLIKTYTIGSGGAASIDFTSIPATFTDICLKISARTNYTGSQYGYIDLAFNTLTTNQSYRRLLGYSTAANSSTDTANSAMVDSDAATASTFGNWEMMIPNYAGSNYKSFSIDAVTENNAGTSEAAFCALVAGLWSASAAISRITISPRSGYGTLINQYSTASLYGILKA